MNWRQDVGNNWTGSEHEQVRVYIARMAPALMARIMQATGLLLADAAAANKGARADANYLRLPAASVAAYTRQVNMVEKVIAEENARHGGVMIPLEGAPWVGRREGALVGAPGNSRNMDVEFVLWKQLFVAARMLCKDAGVGTEVADEREIIEVPSRRLIQLHGMYECPALAQWRPESGFRFGEVRAVMAILTGTHVDERSYAVLTASGKIPELRIMPLPSEVAVALRGEAATPASRTEVRATRRDPARASKNTMNGQMSLFGDTKPEERVAADRQTMLAL